MTLEGRIGSFSRSREKAGDEGAARYLDPHANPLPHPGEGVMHAQR